MTSNNNSADEYISISRIDNKHLYVPNSWTPEEKSLKIMPSYDWCIKIIASTLVWVLCMRLILGMAQTRGS